MAVPEEDKRDDNTSWDKCWIFLLASICMLALVSFGTWGRVRMLEDDNIKLATELDSETRVHEQMEYEAKRRLRRKNKLYGRLQHEVAIATHHFEQLNASMRGVKAHVADALREAGKLEASSELSTECQGVVLPAGFEFTLKGQTIFPHDVSTDATGLHALLQADESLAPMLELTTRLEQEGLFTQPTYPWAQWTWLRALLDRPQIKGNFTEWGVGAGGSAMFVAGLARMQGASCAGFDSWGASEEASQSQAKLQQFAKQCGLSVPKDVRFYDLSSPSLAWPENGEQERLAFTHIDSDDHNTTLGILSAVYNNTIEGGMIAVDNFFHPTGGSKKAVEDFFRKHTPGKLPLIYPIFPGYSVMIFKGRFSNPAEGDTPNALDGFTYSFDFIKGQPEIIDSVNRSVIQLSQVHQTVKDDPKANQTSLCWLNHALGSARRLFSFVQSSKEASPDWEAADVFNFLAEYMQFTGPQTLA